MAYTMGQANIELAKISTEAELRNLISQLDVTSSGSVTVRYSGNMGDSEVSHARQ